jgi:hypothetical protein
MRTCAAPAVQTPRSFQLVMSSRPPNVRVWPQAAGRKPPKRSFRSRPILLTKTRRLSLRAARKNALATGQNLCAEVLVTGYQRKDSRSPHRPGPSEPAWYRGSYWLACVGRRPGQLHRPGHPVSDLPPRGIAMTLKPIQGAPIDAPTPDFPTGKPSTLVLPASRFTRRCVEPLPFSLPPPALLPARQPGPASFFEAHRYERCRAKEEVGHTRLAAVWRQMDMCYNSVTTNDNT